ncbi:MAG: hypothetical protein ABIH27_02095 [Candidatus Omnitrophota bacterium]
MIIKLLFLLNASIKNLAAIIAKAGEIIFILQVLLIFKADNNKNGTISQHKNRMPAFLDSILLFLIIADFINIFASAKGKIILQGKNPRITV